jgi:hypothetical protein
MKSTTSNHMLRARSDDVVYYLWLLWYLGAD